MTTRHYILTRFNLALWRKDKRGEEIDRRAWLERRLRLFETYCLPSVMGQTCGEFRWIMLVDAETPDPYRSRLKAYAERCPQIRLITVRPQHSVRFARIFQEVVGKALTTDGARTGDLCLTTYLDNDDALAADFVEDARRRCAAFGLAPGGRRFLSYDYGLQVFTELGHLTTRIAYPNNHFLTLAECLSEDNRIAAGGWLVKTCYGFGSHFLLERNGLVSVEHIRNRRPMWAEIIHEGNVDNDVKMTIDMRFVTDTPLLRRRFSLPFDISRRGRTAFALRFVKQALRRLRNKIS